MKKILTLPVLGLVSLLTLATEASPNRPPGRP